MNQEEITKKLSEIYLEMQTALNLAKNNLLKSERMHKVVSETKQKLNQPKHGFPISESNAQKELEPLMSITTELIGVTGGQVPKNDIFITENSPFEGRKILRSILNQSKSKILLIDGYLRPEILEVVQQNLVDNQTLEVCFLTQKNYNRFFTTFSVDMKALSAQYPNATLEYRYYDSLPPHDRYIVVDENEVYHSGHSFAELGNRASNINKVEGDAYNEAKKHISDLWLNSNK